jgi:hypothetical protein
MKQWCAANGGGGVFRAAKNPSPSEASGDGTNGQDAGFTTLRHYQMNQWCAARFFIIHNSSFILSL